MTRLEPRIYTLATTTIMKRYQNLEHIFSKKDALQTLILNPKILTYTIENINDKLNFLLKLGYLEQDIKNIIKTNPKIITKSKESITNIHTFFLKKGFKKEEVLAILKKEPYIYSLSIDFLEERITYFKVGIIRYSHDEILSLIKKRTYLLVLSRENLKNKNKFLYTLGYDRTTIKKILLYMVYLEKILYLK